MGTTEQSVPKNHYATRYGSTFLAYTVHELRLHNYCLYQIPKNKLLLPIVRHTNRAYPGHGRAKANDNASNYGIYDIPLRD